MFVCVNVLDSVCAHAYACVSSYIYVWVLVVSVSLKMKNVWMVHIWACACQCVCVIPLLSTLFKLHSKLVCVGFARFSTILTNEIFQCTFWKISFYLSIQTMIVCIFPRCFFNFMNFNYTFILIHASFVEWISINNNNNSAPPNSSCHSIHWTLHFIAVFFEIPKYMRTH